MTRLSVTRASSSSGSGSGVTAGSLSSLQSSVPIAGVYQYNSTLSNGTDTGVNTQVSYVLPAGMTFRAVRLRFANHSSGPTGEVAGANAITLRASVATAAAGPWFQCSVGGSQTMVLDPGVSLDTDPVDMTWGPNPAKLYVKTYLTVTSWADVADSCAGWFGCGEHGVHVVWWYV